MMSHTNRSMILELVLIEIAASPLFGFKDRNWNIGLVQDAQSLRRTVVLFLWVPELLTDATHRNGFYLKVA